MTAKTKISLSVARKFSQLFSVIEFKNRGMKFLLTFAVLSAIAVASNATIAYPSVVFEKLNEVAGLVARYKTYTEGEVSLGRFVELFQQMNPLITKDVFNETAELVMQNAANLAALDAEVRDLLLAEKQNSCIRSMLTFLDQILMQSGFIISNCIDITSPDVFKKTFDYYSDLMDAIKTIEKLPLVLFNPLIGRNVFTQPDEIAARIQELYDIELSDDQETYDRLLAKINIFVFAWHDEYSSIKQCIENVQVAVVEAQTAVKAQLPLCRAVKAARSLALRPLDVADFFP